MFFTKCVIYSAIIIHEDFEKLNNSNYDMMGMLSL